MASQTWQTLTVAILPRLLVQQDWLSLCVLSTWTNKLVTERASKIQKYNCSRMPHGRPMHMPCITQHPRCKGHWLFWSLRAEHWSCVSCVNIGRCQRPDHLCIYDTEQHRAECERGSQLFVYERSYQVLCTTAWKNWSREYSTHCRYVLRSFPERFMFL